MSEHPVPSDEISWPEVTGWLEFGCWTTLALTPFLYFINGPAVSTDQFVVRIGLVVIATVGAISLSCRRLLRYWKARKSVRPTPTQTKSEEREV